MTSRTGRVTAGAGKGLAVAASSFAGVAAAAHLVPSIVSLGTWTRLRVLPGGWCRWRGPDVPAVALTFDDGPDPVTTPLVLDRLDQLGLRATFFSLGERVDAYPELVREVVRRGHRVGSHGYRHEHHLARSPRWVDADLAAGVAALGRAAAIRPRWYRPPYGQSSGATLAAAKRHGVELVLWSAWGREWAVGSAAAVTDNVVPALAGGAIVLLHDSDVSSPPGSAARALEALGPIAEALDRRGLAAVTLDELVSAR